MPIRWRMTIWYTIVLLLILVVLGSVVYLLLDYSLTAEMDRNLEQKADEVLRSTRIVGELPFFLRQVVLPDVEVFAAPDTYLQIVAGNGEIAVKSNNLGDYSLPVTEQIMQDVLEAGESYSITSVENEELRMLIKPLYLGQKPIGVLQVARPMKTIDLALTRLKSILFLGSLIASLISLLIGWIISGKAVQPIRYLAEEAQKIGEDTDFKRRVNYKGPADEIGGLALTFNNMLVKLDEAYKRLEDALNNQKRFVADASHELRTPLTSILGNAEFLMRKAEEGKCEDLDKEVIADISSETRRVSVLVKDLLALAKADSGFKLELVPLEIKPLLENVIRQIKHLHTEHVFEADLKAADGLQMALDSVYFTQMLLIFLDNAFRYTPPGKRVSFSASVNKNELCLIIEDEGIGIPEKDQPYIFERFYRAQDSRTGEGTGLGLSIASWIIDQHKGKIILESLPEQGTKFMLCFPTLILF